MVLPTAKGSASVLTVSQYGISENSEMELPPLEARFGTQSGMLTCTYGTEQARHRRFRAWPTSASPAQSCCACGGTMGAVGDNCSISREAWLLSTGNSHNFFPGECYRKIQTHRRGWAPHPPCPTCPRTLRSTMIAGEGSVMDGRPTRLATGG